MFTLPIYRLPSSPRSSSPPATPVTRPYAHVSIHSSPGFGIDLDLDDDDDDDGFSFAPSDIRATFFRVSAERGRWRYDPPRATKSSDAGGGACAYSPLPPSSPPPSSPLSFAPSSPVLLPSSPLSFSDQHEDTAPADDALRTMDENGLGVRTAKRKEPESEENGASSTRKKPRVASCPGKKTRRTKRRAEEENEPVIKVKKQRITEDVKPSKQRKSRSASPSLEDTTLPSSSKTLPPTNHPPTPAPNPVPAADPDTTALHSEIRGMLIETLASSRASSLPASALYKSAIRSRPALAARRTEREWVDVIQRVLEEGRGDTGVFGKVESSFKDAAGRPLEAQWFYVPEKDEDQERAALIRSMMPRPAKRNETKKYKQYYYRPLSKISRWDREEDL